MRPASGPSSFASAHAAVGLTLVLGVVACAPRDGVVGAAPGIVVGGVDGGTDAPSVLFSSELATNGGDWDVVTPVQGERVTFGVAQPGTDDGLVAALRFPGDPALAPADRSDSALNVGISTRQYFRFGTFRARVQFATCAPTEELASAVFLYLSDGRDGNGNGITDVDELDLQQLCGTPSVLVVTAWSDYDLTNGVATYRKVSHAVDTATGDVYDTPVPTEPTFTKTGNDPTLVHAGFPAPGAFYDVGIEWQATQVRFFIVLGGAEVTLWTLRDLAYVPQVPLPLMFNLWHPATHWVPTRTAASYPAQDGVMLVDRASWTSLTSSTSP
jgi:hypothetical protein